MNTENWYQRNGMVAETKVDLVVLKPLELVCGRNLVKFRDVCRSPKNTISRV
jgi:hypothetical protein